jgi:anti-anti-sigma factor
VGRKPIILGKYYFNFSLIFVQDAGHRLNMEQANEILLEQLGDITLLDIRGDVTILSESFLNDAYADANSQGVSKILLKFEENAYINSGGISVLIQLLAQTQKNNQQIGITGLSDHFKKIFNMVGITKFAKIYNTREEALEGMS